MRILELNDVGLRLFEGGRLIDESPGCAALDRRQLVTGNAAQARLRLDPRRANDRYWYALDAMLPAPLGTARSAADLAHAQLHALGGALTAQPLVLAAPASASAAQLGVLLGILEALGVKTRGLVDSAVAAASGVVLDRGPWAHLDVQRHRLVLTPLGDGDAVARGPMQELKPGLSALQDRSAGVIAEAFVRHARFDPLHDAATEQALYARLPGWMAQLAAQAQAVLELDIAGRVHRIGLHRDALQAALADRLNSLAEAVTALGVVGVLVSDRAAQLPGLVARLPRVRVLEADAVARGVAAHLERIVSDDAELPWVTRLPRRVGPDQAPSEAAAGAGEIPTHALIEHCAHPLPAPGSSLALSAWLPGAPGLLRLTPEGCELCDAQGSDVTVNGAGPGPAQALRPGDRLAWQTAELRLIRVLDARSRD